MKIEKNIVSKNVCDGGVELHVSTTLRLKVINEVNAFNAHQTEYTYLLRFKGVVKEEGAVNEWQIEMWSPSDRRWNLFATQDDILGIVPVKWRSGLVVKKGIEENIGALENYVCRFLAD